MVGKDFLKRVVRFRFGPNPQSAVGATVGLIAVLQPWLIYEGVIWGDFFSHPITWPHYGVIDYSLLDVIAGNVLGVGFFCALFLFGTLLSVISPAGAVPQVVGLLGFTFGYGAVDLPLWTGSEPVWSFGLGYAMGAASTLIVMGSPVRAMLRANGGKPVRMLGRFAALSPGTISSWK